MEKKISIEMLTTKDISIKVNDVEKLEIDKDKREITADDIYNIIDHSKGDTYKIEVHNQENIDNKVIDFFAKLFKEIVEDIQDDNSVEIEAEY